MGFCALGLGFKKKKQQKMGMGFQFEQHSLGLWDLSCLKKKTDFLGNGIRTPPSRPSYLNLFTCFQSLPLLLWKSTPQNFRTKMSYRLATTQQLFVPAIFLRTTGAGITIVSHIGYSFSSTMRITWGTVVAAMMTLIGKIQKYVLMSSKTLQREILEIIAACHTIKQLARMALSSGILKVSIKNNFSVSRVSTSVVNPALVG